MTMSDVVLTAGDCLQVLFRRVGDRWRHVIQLKRALQSDWMLMSIDGTPADSWPASPPFQSLELHTTPDQKQTALLVGMAGGNHWSASVETNVETERIAFDVACRIGAEPTWLGSSYSIAPSVCADVGPRPQIDMDEALSSAGGIRPVVKTADGKILVQVTTNPGPLPRTVRWRYVVTVEGQNDLAGNERK